MFILIALVVGLAAGFVLGLVYAKRVKTALSDKVDA